MRSRLGQAEELAPVRTRHEGAPVAVPTTKELPYDHVARFTLEGRRGNRVQDVINVSVDGAFVAVAIGYSFIPAPLPDLNAADKDPILTDWATNELTVTKQPPDGILRAFLGIQTDQLLLGLQPVVDLRKLLQCLLLRLCGVDFKYSIIDSATGRELQNQPIHNIAGLGEPGGNRPFRPLAKPILFMPRSTIRIEVEELSEGPIYGFTDRTGRRVGAELFIVLHGYKILGYGSGAP